MSHGDAAVRNLVASRRPLFEFAIQSVLAGVSLATAEGRTAGLRAAAPMVASIRDRVLRGEYTRQLGGWLGMDEATVRQAVASAARSGGGPRRVEPAVEGPAGPPALVPRQRLRDPVERVERLALDVYLQLPWYALPAQMDDLPSQTFTVPIHRRVHDAIRAAGGASAYARHYEQLVADGREHDRAVEESARWYLDAVAEAGDDAVARAVGQLAVEDLPETRPDRMEHYVWGIAVSLIRQGITRQIGDLHSELQRTPPDDPAHGELFARLMELEAQRRACEEQIQ